MVKKYDFKNLPIEIEVKDLSFIKEHSHILGKDHRANFHQVIWVTEGEACFQIDFKEVKVKSNEIFIITADQICKFDTDHTFAGKMILFTNLFFGVSEFDLNFLHSAEIFNPTHLNQTMPFCPELMHNLISLLEIELSKTHDSLQGEIAHSYLKAILLESERKFNQSHSFESCDITRSFYNKVEKHFKENRNVEYYVEQIGINEKLLSQRIKYLTGDTPKHYIDSRVILEAKRLLCYTKKIAKEIAFELGFDEPTNFNKYFKKHTGCTPVYFRKQFQTL